MVKEDEFRLKVCQCCLSACQISKIRNKGEQRHRLNPSHKSLSFAHFKVASVAPSQNTTIPVYLFARFVLQVRLFFFCHWRHARFEHWHADTICCIWDFFITHGISKIVLEKNNPLPSARGWGEQKPCISTLPHHRMMGWGTGCKEITLADVMTL